jgi:hypothetical protein
MFSSPVKKHKIARDFHDSHDTPPATRVLPYQNCLRRLTSDPYLKCDGPRPEPCALYKAMGKSVANCREVFIMVLMRE